MPDDRFSICSVSFALAFFPHSCCYADSATQVETCSETDTSSGPSIVASCPSPPAIAIDTLTTFGQLEGYDIYVDEHLLNIGNDITASVLHQRFVGGFVLHPNPVYSTCGCRSREESCLMLMLTPASESSGATCSQCSCCLPFSSMFEIDSCTDSTKWNDTYDGAIDACLNYTLCQAPSPTDGTPVASMQCVHPELCTERLVGKVSSPPLATDELTVTIWFNNQVKHLTAF